MSGVKVTLTADPKDMAAIPHLTYEQRSALDEQKKLLQSQTAALAEQTRFLEALKGVDLNVLREAQKANRRARDYMPRWATLWLVYIGAWAWLMMTFRANVWPGK